MKIFRRRVMLVGIGVAIAMSIPPGAAADTTAEPAASGAMGVAQPLALAQEVFHLSDDQVKLIQPLVEGHVKALRSLFEKYAPQGEVFDPSFTREFERTRNKFQTSVDPVLDKEQSGASMLISKMIDDSLPDLISDDRLAVLKDRLNLGDYQVTAVRPVIMDDFEKKEAILFAGASQAPGTPGPSGEEYQKVQDETEKRLLDILTSEQMEEYSAYVEELAKSIREKEGAGK